LVVTGHDAAATISIRAWLADKLGVDPTSLRIVDRTDDGRDALIMIGTAAYAQVHVLVSGDQQPRACGIVAAWPGGSGRVAIPPGVGINW